MSSLSFAAADTAPPGETIALQGTANGVTACIACHGAHGEGNAAAGFPRLAGLSASYLADQLAAFAAGQRQNAVMQPLAKLLSPDERKGVAQYFSQLPAPVGLPTADRKGIQPSDTGAWLATRGRWGADLPACVQCHGVAGVGVAPTFPPLAGQPAAYLANQLLAWKKGLRPPGPMGLMPALAGKLSDADITAVAAYYAGEAPAQSGPAEVAGAAAGSAAQVPAAVAPTSGAAQAQHFAPPAETAMPGGDFGQSVKLGEQIFTHTKEYAGQYVGNSLNCASCHLDAGRKADSGPLWAAYISYPAYRSKNGHVNSFAERMQGCFNYSMNGKPPPLGDPVLVALESYAFWLAQGAPVGMDLAGRGYPKLAAPARKPDYARGAQLYAQHCALCHGANGQGQSVDGKTVFPPLWGAQSFNWGAGMHEIQNAAGFIKANMPLGLGGTLTDQEAWDLATFMDSQPRPQDPRFTGSVEATRAKYHDSPWSMYGKTVNGHVLGSE